MCIIYVNHMCASYVCVICVHHMCVSYVCVRYIWGYRTALARTVHDTLQQQMSPRYTALAFAPLKRWVFTKGKTPKRQQLYKFRKDDEELFQISTKCLRAYSMAQNLPWGRPCKDKVYFLELNREEKVLAFVPKNSLFFLAFAFP